MWIVPERASLADLQGGLDTLLEPTALESSEIRLLRSPPDRPVFVPEGLTLAGGEVLSSGQLTPQTLPREA